MYEHLNLIAVGLIDDSRINKSNFNSVPFALLAFLMIFFPLSGFMADVFCGRLRYVIFSLVMLLLALLIASANFIIIYLTDKNISVFQAVHLDSIFENRLIILLLFLGILSFLLLIFGLTFYNLNPTSKLLGSPSYARIVLLARKTALAFLHHKNNCFWVLVW